AKMVPDFLGLLHFGNKYSLILGIKHILYGIMIIISVLRSRIGWKKENSPNPKTLKIKALMLIINMILGVAVLFLSALNAAVVL
ncbi:MAG: hypothetical protein L3J12_07020, partial [Spirochaetales bacterium]|nr:hypothetical protein [Spirochaetales bacterium]